MKTLDEIAISFGTDKSSRHHNYTKLYSCYFDSLRLVELNVLEVGIAGGESLKMWKDYFPNAKIIGLDILDLKFLEEKRIHIFQGDQSDRDFLMKVNAMHGPFDVIIDDGSHRNRDMKASFEVLFPLLKPGGLYVVEDLHACYTNEGAPVFINAVKKIVDHVNASGKSICANIKYDETNGEFYIQAKENDFVRKNITGMNWWEKSVEFMHLYRSIIFIKKSPFNIQIRPNECLQELKMKEFKTRMFKCLSRHIPAVVKKRFASLLHH